MRFLTDCGRSLAVSTACCCGRPVSSAACFVGHHNRLICGRCADPQLGIDSRNQFDMTASLPGGLPGLKNVVAEFHRRGIAVSWPFNPWDQGTRGGNAGISTHSLDSGPHQAFASDARLMASLL
eukprot:SAG31_NODE_25604_length_458_cov_0.863510_1_plen_123_part_01